MTSFNSLNSLNTLIYAEEELIKLREVLIDILLDLIKLKKKQKIETSGYEREVERLSILIDEENKNIEQRKSKNNNELSLREQERLDLIRYKIMPLIDTRINEINQTINAMIKLKI